MQRTQHMGAGIPSIPLLVPGLKSACAIGPTDLGQLQVLICIIPIGSAPATRGEAGHRADLGSESCPPCPQPSPGFSISNQTGLRPIHFPPLPSFNSLCLALGHRTRHCFRMADLAVP
jgi:hypothetical protein